MQRTVLAGEYEHVLDDKGRVTLPAKYREFFQGGTFLVRLPDEEPSIRVYDTQGWNDFDTRYLEPLQEYGSDDDGWRIRNVFRNLWEVDPDKAGRILLPGAFIDELGLEGKVRIIGNRTHLEIWNPATLAALDEERERRVS
jgi:MraZ protein